MRRNSGTSAISLLGKVKTSLIKRSLQMMALKQSFVDSQKLIQSRRYVYHLPLVLVFFFISTRAKFIKNLANPWGLAVDGGSSHMLYKGLNKAPKASYCSRYPLHFCITGSKLFTTLYPFLKSYWDLDKSDSKYFSSRLYSLYKRFYFCSFQLFWKRRCHNNIIKIWKEKLLADAKFFFNKLI